MTDATSPPEPVVPRPAATLVLLRPGPDGLEVLLGRRPGTMAFGPGIWVFPGGRVDAADADPGLVARSAWSPDDAAEAMGGGLEPLAAIGAAIAAVREAFEEAGILLAEPGPRAALPASEALAGLRVALLRGELGFGAIADRLDLRLHTDRLIPLSRWVTPAGSPRRFDTRFFAAELPADAIETLEGDEVEEHTWMRPIDALEAMAGGRIDLWPPTAATLQGLSRARDVGDVRRHLAAGRLGSVRVDDAAPDVTRIEMPAGGGVPGQPVCAYLVGRRAFVLVDPGDPTDPGLDAALAAATDRGGQIRAIALTRTDPDHAAGAAILADRFGWDVLVGPGGGRHLPYPTRELADGEVIEAGDVPLHAVATPGIAPEHLALVIGAGSDILIGDLDGAHGARTIPAPVDADALAASRARVDGLGIARRWPAHPVG